jgi:hypothetical protein
VSIYRWVQRFAPEFAGGRSASTARYGGSLACR